MTMQDLRKLALARFEADPVLRPRQLIVPRDETGDSDETEIKLYDAIDSWGGFWGISAAEVGEALEAVETPRIKLRINSPGGEVFEAVAIYNLFADHDAEVHVSVDSIAASAASFIAMAGDKVTMNRGSEMMIHSAWGGVVGNAEKVRDYADLLDRQTNKIAEIYQAAAGGPVDAWLDAMAAETWYSADEAVEAGLADEAVAPKGKANPDTGDSGDTEGSGEAENRWGGLFKYPSRAQAPAPTMPNKSAIDDRIARLAEAFNNGHLSPAEARALNELDPVSGSQFSTGAAPEAAPDDEAAAVAAERWAAARQRRAAVDIARARLALASSSTRGRDKQ